MYTVQAVTDTQIASIPDLHLQQGAKTQRSYIGRSYKVCSDMVELEK